MSNEKELNMTDLWAQTMTAIKAEITPTDYNAWFSRLHFASVQKGEITLNVPSAFYRDSFEKLYKSLLENSFGLRNALYKSFLIDLCS